MMGVVSDPYVARVGWAATNVFRMLCEGQPNAPSRSEVADVVERFSALMRVAWEAEGQGGVSGGYFGERQEWIHRGLVILLALERAADDPDADVLGPVSTRWIAVADEVRICAEEFLEWAEERDDLPRTKGGA